MHDVAIIGAGPSGSYTAYLLAKEGYNVIILDRRSDSDPETGLGSRQSSGNDGVVCTGIVSKEAFERFLLPEDTIIGNISSARFVSPCGETFRYEHPSTIAYILDRSAFERSLLRRALEKGVTFLSKVHVDELKIKRDYVELQYRINGEYAESIKARVSVIATGVNLSLLKKAGLKGPEDFLIGTQAETDFDGLSEIEIYLGKDIAPNSFAWLVPLGNGRARVGLSMKGDAVYYLKNLLQNPYIRKRLRGNGVEIRCRPIPFGSARKTYGHRVLSVGDAAGQVKTTTGGGIYYGLIGAELASQTLQEAFKKGDFTPSTLKVYEMKWREVLGPEIETGLRLRRIYATLEDRKIDQLIKIAKGDGIIPLIRMKAMFDWQKRFFHSLLSKPIIKRLLNFRTW